MVVTEIRDDGNPEMLGAKIADREGELFGSGLFQDPADLELSRTSSWYRTAMRESRKQLRNRSLVPHGNGLYSYLNSVLKILPRSIIRRLQIRSR